MDVTIPESIKKVNQQLINSGLSVDILINNAAINISANSVQNEMRFENFPLSKWHHEFEVGLTGAILCCQVFGEHMAKQRRGVIINVASDLSVIAPNQNLYRVEGLEDKDQPVKPFSYSVIKTGLLGLSRYLATYWAQEGVRVNAISPGGVEFNQSEEFIKRISELVPMNRMAQESDLIGAIQFLATDASSYMTGQNLIIDGGRSIW
jgi:NAD(P)-dependent dehydrogenase (short-subunit alcohol dehydrogenase family)